MKKPVLVIMAAGMGSRYGGPKQIDPVDEYGNLLIDFSIYDALKAGFEKIVFIITRAMEKDFMEVIGKRIAQRAEIQLVYQDMDALPEGFSLPAGRKKPWGTGHAILCCADVIDSPFAVINADDYYGSHAFQMIYDSLLTQCDGAKYSYSMVGYILGNTLTENGHVARGVCSINDQNLLTSVTERTRIEKRSGGAAYTEDGETWIPISENSIVSMNLWGFTPSILTELKLRFPPFLEYALRENPEKSEYFLPSVVNELVSEGKADVKVLCSPDQWYGVTYRPDHETVVAAIRGLKERKIYPPKLWEESK